MSCLRERNLDRVATRCALDLTNVLWLYIILGVIAAAAALYRLVLALLGRGRWWALHGMALGALAGAWLFEHRGLTGWICLATGIFVELLAFFTKGTEAFPGVTQTEEFFPEPQLNENREPPTQADMVPSFVQHARTFFTLAFLKRPCDLSPPVLLASLRRLGQRDATLDDVGPKSSARFVIGNFHVDVQVNNIPCNQNEIDAAVGQNWERPATLEIIAKHQAHVFFISSYDDPVSRDQIVRLHHRAHAALAEFAPVIGVLWPDAGKLYPLEKLERLAKPMEIAQLSASCTTCRAFALDQDNARFYITDSLGLHAFGLPDIQMITKDHPLPEEATFLQELVNQFFESGCDLQDGSTLQGSNGHIWRTKRMRSTFTPDREVIQLTTEHVELVAGTNEDSPD